ncbi:MAG: HD domain-containing protein [Campylobacterota bacterium]|nr:HD domain-containing protein [Campylobacterota bacterium]
MDNVKAQIEELLYENAADFQIAKVLKKDIKLYFDTLEETFANTGGKDFLVKHTKRIDNVIKIIYKVALRSMFGDYAPMKNSVPIGLVALGSYGREQLCVHSDIDLMIVYKEIPGYNIKEMIEKILYILWDTGLKLGHRVHTIEELYEVSKTDITIKTALIESRFIEGSHFIWVDTQNAISKIRHDDITAFIELKLEEQRIKHRKFPLTMEPNLKDGVGGFRDANLVFWIGKAIYNVDNIKNLPSSIVNEKEYRAFRIALEFLFRVRSALHLATSKKEDKLRLDLIPSIAKLLRYDENKQGHMKFAKKVTESLKIVRLYSTIWLDKLTKEYLIVDKNLNFIYPKSKEFEPLLRELSQHAQKPFYAHSSFHQTLLLANKPERPGKAIYKIIAKFFHQPYSYYILSALSFSRHLKYVIQPIKKVVDLPQFDGYHEYAVDIHSLKSVYHLEHIEDTFIQDLFKNLENEEKALLKLVTFLHDAGKGRKRDHHAVGASLFKIFANKLYIDPKLIKIGETLILYHTLMSNIAQREDLYNEKVILSFASHFKTKKLLDMIYILTYADMKGVGEGTYNSFNSRLIKTLYLRSTEVLNHTVILDEAAKRIKKEQTLKKSATFLKLKKSEQKKILQIPSNLLFLRYKPERIVAVAKKGFQTIKYNFSLSNKNYLTVELIRTDSFNLGYFLSKLSKLDVVNMDICKLFDNLKYFKIDFSVKVDNEDILLIEEILHDSFDNSKKSKLHLPVIQKNEVEIDCEYSKSYAMMRLNTTNQKGLLAYIINLFDELDIDIVSAKIHTLKYSVRDIFLIEKNGNFCHNTDKIIDKLTEGNK